MNFTIQQIDITLTMSDYSTQSFTLEAPNSDTDPFVFGFRKVNLRPNYRDRNLVFRRGSQYYQFFCNLNYDTHNMDPRLLLVAKSIELKIPPSFLSIAGYQKYDCRLSNENVVRNWLRGLVMGGVASDIDGDEGLQIPSAGSITLNFIGTKPFTESELLDTAIWHQSLGPYKPENLMVDQFSGNSITVSWDQVLTPDLAGYNIYANDVKNNTSLVEATTYQATGLSFETEYDVEVSAVDEDGNESPRAKVTQTTAGAVGPYIFIKAADFVVTVRKSDGAQIFEKDLDGADQYITLDHPNGYLYNVMGNDNIRQFSYDKTTLEVTTPSNWVNNSLNNASHVLRIDLDGYLYAIGNDSNFDPHIAKIDPSNGNQVWSYLIAYHGTGFAVGPDWIVVPNGFNTSEYEVIDLDGNFVETWNLKTVGGANVSGETGRPAVDKNGFLFIAGMASGNKGIYRVDPSDWSTTHFYAHAGDGEAGLIVPGNDYLLYTNSDEGAPPDGFTDPEGYILKCSDLSFIREFTIHEAPDINTGSLNEMYVWMDAEDTYYLTDPNDNRVVNAYDIDGNLLWSTDVDDLQPVRFMASPPGEAFPFLYS